MSKQYQTTDVQASMSSVPGLAVPEQVTVALAEIAESATEGLLALAVGAGLQVVQTLMEESVVALAGPKGKHNPDRTAVRHGHEHGSVTLGGRRVAVQRPRVRAADGSGELPVAAYELFSSTELLDLLVGLRERGLDVTRPILVVIDGAKALRRAVLDVFDHPAIGRCQQHKLRNVRDKLPERLGGPVERRMRAAYHAASALDAQAQLSTLARELDKTHPGAAASLREGLDETLTVLRLGVPPTLARTLRSTNTIESMISICRDHAGNVKRWQDGQMALRWCAAGMVEARKQFRRVNGYLHLPALRAALEAEVAKTVTGSCEDQEEVEAA